MMRRTLRPAHGGAGCNFGLPPQKAFSTAKNNFFQSGGTGLLRCNNLK
jgi:hypothetical protein